jgi:hypothetical protein
VDFTPLDSTSNDWLDFVIERRRLACDRRYRERLRQLNLLFARTVRTRQREQHNKNLFFYFEKKVGVTAEPPAPQYHVARFLSCACFRIKNSRSRHSHRQAKSLPQSSIQKCAAAGIFAGPVGKTAQLRYLGLQ